MTEEKEVKAKAKAQTKAKNPAATESQTLDISPVIEALKSKEWTAEKHRGNPQYVTGVVIHHLVPKIVKLLD